MNSQKTINYLKQMEEKKVAGMSIIRKAIERENTSEVQNSDRRLHRITEARFDRMYDTMEGGIQYEIDVKIVMSEIEVA